MLAKLQWFGVFLRAREINFRRKCENQTIKCSVLNYNEDKEKKKKKERRGDSERRRRKEKMKKGKEKKGYRLVLTREKADISFACGGGGGISILELGGKRSQKSSQLLAPLSRHVLTAACSNVVHKEAFSL